jgi:hypothetical protein
VFRKAITGNAQDAVPPSAFLGAKHHCSHACETAVCRVIRLQYIVAYGFGGMLS